MAQENCDKNCEDQDAIRTLQRTKTAVEETISFHFPRVHMKFKLR